MRTVNTYTDYLNAPPDTEVTVDVTVAAGRLIVDGVEYGPGDTFAFTGARRVPRSWERAGAASVKVPRKKPRKKKGSK